MATARYRLYVGKDTKYHFSLIAPNNENILKSQAYSSKANAEKGIHSVRENGPNREHYKIETAVNGDHYFNLHATNGQVIGTSQMYSSKQAAEKGIEAVMKYAADAPVVEE